MGEDRDRTLRRIAAVQADMVKLAEWRLAAADGRCRELEADRLRLAAFVSGESALGQPLAKAALRTAGAIDAGLRRATAEAATLKRELDVLRRRDHAVSAMAQEAAAAARRRLEASELDRTVEAWLAAKGSSLP